MNNFFDGLYYKCLTFQFKPEDDIKMRFWIGAVLRNRFLYEAEHVKLDNDISLRQLIGILPVSEKHFLFNQWKGGFPKGFLFDCTALPHDNMGFTLFKDKTYTIKLILIGCLIDYEDLFVETVSRMLENGFGHPIVSLRVESVVDDGLFKIPEPFKGEGYVEIDLEFITPINIVHSIQTGNMGYQSKMNRFPSFYQFMRSLMYRLISLSMLYGDENIFQNLEQMENVVEGYIEASMDAILLKADLQLERINSSPKKGSNKVYVMDGYTGHLIFGKVESKFVPLLKFSSLIGVGSNINFGLGAFRVKHFTNILSV